jgi:hypothetical protein
MPRKALADVHRRRGLAVADLLGDLEGLVHGTA